MGKVVKAIGIAAVIVGLAIATGGVSLGATATLTGGIAGTMAIGSVGLMATTAMGSMMLAIAASTVLSAVSAELFGPKMPKGQMSRLSPTLDPSAYRKAVFGETAMSTDIRYFEPSGTDQEYFDYIIATSAHKVESIDEIWFDDSIAWTSSGGVDAAYSGYLTIATRTEGTSANTISINSGVKWGSTRRLTGCSYIHLRIKRTGNSKKAESPLVNGLPGRLTIRGKGALIYDPRLDSTVPGGSGSHRANDQTTWGTANSTNRDNTALQMLWYLLGWKINGKVSVGCGIPPNRLDLASFITAANVCDENITLAAGGTQKRYRTAGVAADNDSRTEVMQIFLTAMNGSMRDVDGQLSIICMKNDLSSPVLSFTDDDVLGGFNWNQTRGLTESFNSLRGRYTDPSNSSLYQLVEYPEVELTSVDGIDRVQTLDLPFVQDGKRAQRIAKQVLERTQYKGVFSATFTAKALGCKVGDCVYLTFAALGWTSKPFRVISQEINSTGQIPLTLLEENAAIYAWDADERAVVEPTAPTVYDPLNSPLILGISDAQAIADGKIASFYQTTAPTATGIGDIWFDTDDGNKMYRWNGSSWVVAQDTAITTAITAASDAQATADGKVTTFFQDSAPTPEAVGDLWIETDANNKLWRWNGSTWVLSTDTRVTAAINTDGTIATDKVVTDSVTDNAITIPGAAYTSTSQTVSVGTGWQTIQTFSYTSSGADVIILSSFSANAAPSTASYNMRIQRNGTTIWTNNISLNCFVQTQMVSFTTLDTPSAGSVSYTLQLECVASAVVAGNRNLSVLETKK